MLITIDGAGLIVQSHFQEWLFQMGMTNYGEL
jgi:hypothetical protein